MFLLNPFAFSQSGFVFDHAKVKLLLNFDGNFNDSSSNNHAMTSGGNVSISTSEPKFGTGKLQFGITPRNGFVKSPNIFDFGNKRPFTISFFTVTGTNSAVFLQLVTRQYARLWSLIAAVAVFSSLVMLH